MKLKLLSDLHIDNWVACQRFPVGTGEILVLAGDILCAKHFKTNGHIHHNYEWFLEECSKNYEHVLYVNGNHEYYGYHYEKAKAKILEHLPDNFHHLDNNTVTINNWNFIGATLWTDFCNENPIEMLDAGMFMNDYKAIRIGSNFRKLNVNDVLGFHKQSKNYILEQLRTLKENVFIISHHAPSFQSVAEEFLSSSCNGAYCSNQENLILEHPQIRYWCHGHTHTAFDYNIGNCRVLCNPVGYPNQRTGYNPDLVIELDGN
jgi:predicted phosphodiesterase